MKLLADECFSLHIVKGLRVLGFDVITIQDIGLGGIGYPDESVLECAQLHGRVLITFNRKDFIRLHRFGATHSGIVACNRPIRPIDTMVADISLAVASLETGEARLIKITNRAK